MRRKKGSGIHIDMGGVGEYPPMVKEQVKAPLALSFIASQPVPQQEPGQPLVLQDVVTTSWAPHWGVVPTRLALPLLMLLADALRSQPSSAVMSHDHHMTSQQPHQVT